MGAGAGPRGCPLESADPYPWSLLTRALEAEGDWRRAQAVYWHARRRFPHDVQCHSQLAHALVLHGDADLGEATYRTAIRLFPDNPVCRNDLAHTLRITDHRDQAVAVYREAQQQFPRNPVTLNGLADTLIDLERFAEAGEVLDQADQLDFDKENAANRDQICRRLQGALSGEPIRPAQPRSPHEGPAGDPDTLADITGEDLAQDPAFGHAVLLRRSGNGTLDRAKAELETLPPGSNRIVETGLWHARAKDWRAAADWFAENRERYPGDGVLRVHRNRAHARAGDTVDWAPERKRYPYLGTVIETEMEGRPPARIGHLDPDAEDLTQEQRQDIWFLHLAGKGDADLRDIAEEDTLLLTAPDELTGCQLH